MQQANRWQLILVPVWALFMGLLLVGKANSATIGKSDQGLEFAKQNCAECHAILPRQNLSPTAAATPFQKISEVPGMTEMALRVFFRTPHKTMPNLIIAGEDQDDVIAYILSLRPKQ